MASSQDALMARMNWDRVNRWKRAERYGTVSANEDVPGSTNRRASMPKPEAKTPVRPVSFLVKANEALHQRQLEVRAKRRVRSDASAATKKRRRRKKH
jgi:hypothetical protein